MFKKATIHVHNPTQEMYDSIPLPEASTGDDSLRWKSFDNVTVFAPRSESNRTMCEITFAAFEPDMDFDLQITQING